MNYQLRLENLVKNLPKHRLDGVVITLPVNLFYFTGVRLDGCALVVTGKDAALFASPMFYDQVVNYGLKLDVYLAKDGVGEEFNRFLTKKKLRSVGLELGKISYAFWEKISSLSKIKWGRADNLIEELRQIKDAEEIECIRQACRIAQAAFRHCRQIIKPGVSEKEVGRELEYFMKKKGAEKSSFELIVAGGKNSAYPHHFTSDYVFQKDDSVLIDWGCFYKGYASDLTRVIFLGKITKLHSKLLKTVANAQKQAIAKIKPGMKASQIDWVARQTVTKAGFEDRFIHNTGHGIGLEIHEGPYLSSKSKSILKSGMVITVEPGIYLPGLGGIRIEDTVLVTKSGVEALTGNNGSLRA
ncbi:MAG: Xaa-Pro peptidase family protein [Elusimicrobiota bacterium]